MRVLGIETSCDETSAAVLDGRGDDVVQRSLVIRRRTSTGSSAVSCPRSRRGRTTAIVPVVERALADAGMTQADVEAVAVTNAPGLVGALLVGVSFAKSFAFALGVPLIGVHHMEGHLFATALEHRDAVPPFTALLVSGGTRSSSTSSAGGATGRLAVPATTPPARRSTRLPSPIFLVVRTSSGSPLHATAMAANEMVHHAETVSASPARCSVATKLPTAAITTTCRSAA